MTRKQARTTRHFYYLVLAVLVITNGFTLRPDVVRAGRGDLNSSSSAASLPPSTPSLRDEEAISYLKQQGLYASLGEAMRSARYGVHWTEHTPWKDAPGAFYA